MNLSTTRDVVELMLEVPQGQVLKYDLPRLCSALGIDDQTRVVVETDGSGRRAILTVYPSNPLAEIRAVTRADLVMDRQGRIVTGRYHNGRPVRRRLFDPQTGSAQRFLLFGTTGAGKSRALQIQLIAEKANGIATWLADLKEGQSVPEARGNVNFYGSSQEMAILLLRSAVGVAHDRMRRYSAAGRNSFALGGDPLLHVWLDEANRALEKGAPYREEATHLTKELGRTGRSVGVGIGLAAQASHLEELGGSDTLRAMLKEGEVTLLRWSSGMMRQLVSDGLLPADAQLMPIPKTLATSTLRSQFDAAEEDEDAPGTQGMGYLLSGPHPTSMMRHLRCGSIAPTPGLDPEILALYGPEDPACLEKAAHEAAGPAYAARNDPAAMEELCAELRDEKEKEAQRTVIPLAGGKRKASRLEDRVLAALAAFDGEATADEVLAAVNEDGGKNVRVGSIRNALGALADEEVVARAGRGLYSLA